MNPPAGVINLLQTGDLLAGAAELFEPLLAPDQPHRILLERIVSTGQVTPPGEYYDQVWPEWILLLQGEAELSFEDGPPIYLTTGDSLMIQAHRRHRVSHTSQNPPCIWLALHLKSSIQA